MASGERKESRENVHEHEDEHGHVHAHAHGDANVPARRVGCTGVLAIVAAFVGAGLAAIGYFALRGGAKQDETTTTLAGTSAVITAMRDLANLEAASFHVERVIDLRDRQSHMFGLFESQDALLLVAAADIVAGVNLTSMRDGDIQVDPVGRTARVILPPPYVLWSRLDNERTYVHTRTTDALAVRAETLETRARQQAERALREAAIEGGLLLQARKNAARTVETLIKSLGYDQVEVVYREE